MSFSLYYKGTDIYPEVSINTCIHTMHCEKVADSLFVKFNDAQQLWDKWSPKQGDDIRVTDSPADSGKLINDAIIPAGSTLSIEAYSIPQDSFEIQSKSWKDVYLLQLVNEIAQRHDLKVQNLGVEDQKYSFVKQINETDFDFIYTRLMLEGASCLIYDGKLVIYDKKMMESKSVSENGKWTITTAYDFDCHADTPYSKVVIRNGGITGTYEESQKIEKVYDTVIPFPMTDESEANRFARNVMRWLNESMNTIRIKCDFLPNEYSPLSLIDLTIDGISSWDGKAIVTDVRMDHVHQNGTLWARKVIE